MNICKEESKRRLIQMDNDYENERALRKWEDEYLEPDEEQEDDDYIEKKWAYEEDLYSDEIKGIDQKGDNK